MIRCTVESVRIHEQTKQHVVNLRDESGSFLPIWIGPDTAHAIHAGLEGTRSERPLTHDLILAAFEKLGVRVARAGITGFAPYEEKTQQGVFYATLYIVQDGKELELDCRPSDAIAIAVRTGAPIDVDDAIFKRSSVKAG